LEISAWHFLPGTGGWNKSNTALISRRFEDGLPLNVSNQQSAFTATGTTASSPESVIQPFLADREHPAGEKLPRRNAPTVGAETFRSTWI